MKTNEFETPIFFWFEVLIRYLDSAALAFAFSSFGFTCTDALGTEGRLSEKCGCIDEWASKEHKHKHKQCQSTAGNPHMGLSWDSLIYPKDTWAGQK